MEWQVSREFDEDELAGVMELDPAWQKAQHWNSVAANESGITNLARVATLSESGNTVIARTTLSSESRTRRLMNFGYSDKARVYVNGKLVYAGDNTYRTRDYRYLGTIGLFDSVVLPLEPGENEIWIAVTEAFGGWGVLAEIASD